MTTSYHPARARTDAAGAEAAAVTHESAPALRSIRRAGIALAAGTLVWAATFLAFGTEQTETQARIGDLAGFAFQLGVFALLWVQLRTFATGEKRFWRVAFKVEHVLLGLASLWSVLHAISPDLAFLPILDLFWPLSMLGMFVIGVRIAVRGRWKGSLRVWPLIAESWAVICVPAVGILGDPAGFVCGAHLVVGYATLGVLLAVRPHLTLGRA